MSNNTTSNGRLIMAIVAVVAGILSIFLIPKLGIPAMDTILKAVYMKIAQTGKPDLISAAKIVSFFFPFWISLCMASGIILILLGHPLYKGDKWARPIALALLSFPAITGAYMFGPVIFFAKGLVVNALIIALIGLIPYAIILLTEKSSLTDKLENFGVFFLLGVLAAYNFTNGHSSLRMLMGRADSSFWNTEYFAYALGIPAEWLGVVLILIGIPLLAAKLKAGWWLCTSGLLCMLVGTTLFQLGAPSAWFSVGIAMTLANLVLLFTPRISKRLTNQEDQAIPPLGNTYSA